MKQALALLFFLLSTTLLFSQVSTTSNLSYQQQADVLLQKAIEDKECIGISAGFAVNGETKWENAIGFSNLKTQTPFQKNTLTRIASIAKPMTAIAIMQLYEKGKIDLDKPIQTYLPSFPKKEKGAITTRQLLSHSSGIGAYKSKREANNKTDYPNLSAAASVFQDRNLIATPGEAFNYTSYGYVVLGLLIESVSGMTYEEYIQINILDKAGMSETGIEYMSKKYKNKASFYHKKKKGKIKIAPTTSLSDRIPAGGFYSTPSDLLKFGNAILDNTFIEASTLELMIKDMGLKKEGNGYGFGWYLYGENPKYGNIFGHTGGQLGCSSMFMLLPEQHTTIIVLSNTSGALQTVSNIAVQLFDVAAEAKEEK